jgi:hypothetical protein
VTGQIPPKIVLTVFNPIFAALLRSPLHGVVDGQFMLLHFTGRRTGRRYDLVVGRHELDGDLAVMTHARWRMNFQGGADVEVTVDGRRRRARAVLVEDPDQVAATYAAEIARIGWEGSQRRLGLKLAGRAPTLEELRQAVDRDDLALVTLRE